jgi:mRNA-degrading endonuclease RelE of RelBE toxin-antitoxin system
MPIPEIEISQEIEQIIKKLSPEEYEKVRRYIKQILDDRYAYWAEWMGDDI